MPLASNTERTDALTDTRVTFCLSQIIQHVFSRNTDALRCWESEEGPDLRLGGELASRAARKGTRTWLVIHVASLLFQCPAAGGQLRDCFRSVYINQASLAALLLYKMI
jgi:hypothetical protein